MDKLLKFKHVDGSNKRGIPNSIQVLFHGSNKRGMPNSVQVLSSEDSRIEQY